MVHPTHLVLNLFIFFVPLLGLGNGFSIASRDSKFPPPPLMTSLLSPPNTEKPGGMETKTAAPLLPHHVPLDIIPSSDSSRSRALSLVKREVNPADEGRDNNDMLYDPNLMLMSKRSAAALNKVLLAFPGFYDSSSRYNGNDNDMDRSNKEGSYLEPSTYNRDTFSSMQRRGQKDGQKKYLRCFFNAVSCF